MGCKTANISQTIDASVLGIFDDPLVLLEIRKLMFYAIITEVIKLIIKKTTTTTNIKTDSINIKINFFFLDFIC